MYKLVNYMEILVERMFDDATNDLNICKCGRCRLDIKAIALNELEPKYVVSQEGEVYVKLNMMRQQFRAGVLSAIVKGAIIVRDNKHHE